MLVLYGRSNQEELDGRGRWHDRETGEMHTGFWWGDLRERHHLEYVGVDGRIILKQIFKIWDEVRGMDWSDSGQGQVVGAFKCGNEPSGFIKFWNFLTSQGPVSFTGSTLAPRC